MRSRCEREADILDALAGGRGEAALSDDLRAHIAECAACADVASVADALLADRESVMRSAEIPTAGRVWFAATLRARREAERAAMRTARAVQVALLLAAAIVAVAVVGAHAIETQLHAVLASAPAGVAVPLAAVALWLVLAPVAVYFVVTEE